MRTMRTTFLVGRRTQRSTEIVVVDGERPAPIPGPWSLRAVVRRRKDPPSTTRRPSEIVH